MATIESSKNFKKASLRKNVTSFLSENYDWKVSRSVSTGVPLTDDDKNFRSGVIDEYNKRLEKVDAATTIAEVMAIRSSFS